MNFLKGNAIYKVPDGKLLRLSLELSSGKISAIQIRGDFFMHPEEGVEKIEQALVGTAVDKEIVKAVDKAVAENSIEMFGLDSKAVFEAVKMAAGNAK